MANVVVDDSGLKALGKDIARGKRALIGRLAERGFQLLRAEVPVATGNLKQGVGTPDVDYEQLEAQLTVTARSGRSGGGQAEVFGADGKKKKTVSLRPQPGYNYAEVVARGNRKATMTPTNARAFLIPVATAPSGEGYLMIGGQIYIVRRSRKGKPANPFDERAAKRLDEEAELIADGVLKEFV
ncbi:MAG: hypothetical protein ABL959_09550 [Pyrinomonadaceae bacterium]